MKLQEITPIDLTFSIQRALVVALGVPVNGYVLKWDAESELLPAIEAALQGKQLIGARLSEHGRATPAAEGPLGEKHPRVV
jgi:DNA-binding NarL/FixJ family response regulator